MITTRLSSFHTRWPEAIPIALSLATFALFATLAAIGRLDLPASAAAQPIIIVWTAEPTPGLPEQIGRAPASNVSLRPLAAPEPTAVPIPTEEPAPIVVLTPPTPEPEQIKAMNEPRNDTQDPNWYTDIATPEPAFVQAVIGDDPNAKACTGANGVVSPLCGGLTNQQARDALEEQP